MSYFKILNNQRGALILIFVVITLLGGTIAAVLGPQIAPLREAIQAPSVKAIEAAGDTTIEGPTSEEFQDARDLVVTVGNLGLATGAVINSIASVPVGGSDDLLGTGFATIIDVIQSAYVSRGSDPAPTTSNTLPPDVHAPGTCNSSNLSSCISHSSCTSVGGYWHSNNTCSSPPVAVCDNDNLELCTSSDCGDAGGYWYNNYCNFIPEDTCDNDHLYLCESNTCGGAGGYWYDNTCNSAPEPVCDYGHLDNCTNSIDCSNASGYWWSDSTCNSTSSPMSLDSTTILGAWNYSGNRPDRVVRYGTMNFSSGNVFSYTLVDADNQSNGSGTGTWTLSGSTLTLDAALTGSASVSGNPTTFNYSGHGTFVFTR